MTTRRTTSPVPDETEPADDADALALIENPMLRYEHSHWPDAVKEAALAHLANGRSMRETARILGVPPSTLQCWKLSSDPIANRLRHEKMQSILEKVWDVSEELITKVRTAPVGSARDGAIAFAAITERGIQLSHMATVVNAGTGKGTMMDWMKAVEKRDKEREAERLRATIVMPPKEEP